MPWLVCGVTGHRLQANWHPRLVNFFQVFRRRHHRRANPSVPSETPPIIYPRRAINSFGAQSLCGGHQSASPSSLAVASPLAEAA